MEDIATNIEFFAKLFARQTQPHIGTTWNINACVCVRMCVCMNPRACVYTCEVCAGVCVLPALNLT